MVDTECPPAGSPGGWWALTGTPGVGKSSVAAALAPDLLAVEVGDLAVAAGAGRRLGERAVDVDLGRLARFVRRSRPATPVVVAGHLSHLLPIPNAVVLRCHPRELRRRLGRVGGRHPAETHENVVVEALDLVLVEAVRSRRAVWQIDTTGLTVGAVARRVRGIVAGRRAASDVVAWLSDPAVPALLFPRTE